MSTTPEQVLARGQALAARRFFHAAIESLQQSRTLQAAHGDMLSRLHDETGKAYAQLGNAATALHHFRFALSAAETPGMRATCNMHIANTYHHHLSEYDRAHRLLEDVLRSVADFHPALRGALYVNLASVQGEMGFYRDGVESSYRAIACFEEAGIPDALPLLYNNLGLLFLDQHDYDKAEEHLLAAERLGEEEELSLLSDLSRLYLQTGDTVRSADYLRRAIALVSSSILSYSKADVSRICFLVAEFSHRNGDLQTATRMVEKAQLLFGQMNMWKEFEQMQLTLDHWLEANTPGPLAVKPVALFEQFAQFITLMDVIHAQEYLHPAFARLLDVRVIYAEALADACRLPDPDRLALVYASRFADYGLTALELEVVENPMRSRYAWEQYQQHPVLSVKLLEPFHLQPTVSDIIMQHHEHFDGSGYPAHKTGEQIPAAAQILAVADTYAQGVTVEDKPHSQVIKEIQQQSGSRFNPDVVARFIDMFTGS